MKSEEAIEILRERIDIIKHDWSLVKYQKALERAVKALKKQIPKKVTSASNGDKLRFGTCPSCNKRISNVEGGNYCQNCGNAIDWR